MYVPGFNGGKSIRCCDEPALFLSCNNFSDPDIHRTQSRQELHCCNHIYVSCDGFQYCKNISRVLVNHLVHGVLLGMVAVKRVSDPSSREHRNVVEPFPMDLVRPDCHLKGGTHVQLMSNLLEAETPVLAHQPHSGPLPAHIFWRVLPMAYILFDHNMPL